MVWLSSLIRSLTCLNGFDQVVLCFMYYNFARFHQTLRVMPAMEVGISGHVWGLEEIVGLLD